MTAEIGFSAQIRRQREVVIIDLSGDMDSFADAELKRAYYEAEATSAQKIVLNFQEVGYINSTGIALIVGLLAQARNTQRQLAAFGLSSHYRQVFHITRLSDFMEIYENEAAVFSITKTRREK